MDICIEKPSAILDTMHYTLARVAQTFVKDGVELEKGAILTKDRVDRNIDLYKKYCWLWSVYPDLYLKQITPSTSKFKLKFFQVLFIRVCVRHGRIVTIAPRAAGKSFICILALYLICIFRPGSHVFQCAPGKAQGSKIANQKIHQLWELMPLLKEEIIGDGNFGPDYVKLSFRNGSIMDIMSPLNSTRGNRATAGILDEFRDHDPDDISEIILPLLNVDRPMANQDKNPYEPQQVQMWISSAAERNTFAYDKTIELFELSILQPHNVFVWGFDYRIPVKTGLLSKEFLNEMRMSSTFSEAGFAKEYMSRFVGSTEDSWIKYSKLDMHRRLNNPESKQKLREDSKAFYLLAVDVARRQCQTVVVVLKVFPGEKYRINLVNLYVLGLTEEEKQFTYQAADLKRIIKNFNPKECVIDINGLGVGLADEMIKPTQDPRTGEIFPAYGFSNRDEYKAIQPKNCAKILYGIKATPDENSLFHSDLISKINSGCINFLISEKEARNKLLSKALSKKMSLEERAARLLPHELTTALFNEIVNLRIKQTSVSNKLAVETINTRMTKDKFSAFEMGVSRVCDFERQENSRKRNRGLKRQLVFFKSGGEES